MRLVHWPTNRTEAEGCLSSVGVIPCSSATAGGALGNFRKAHERDVLNKSGIPIWRRARPRSVHPPCVCVCVSIRKTKMSQMNVDVQAPSKRRVWSDSTGASRGKADGVRNSSEGGKRQPSSGHLSSGWRVHVQGLYKNKLWAFSMGAKYVVFGLRCLSHSLLWSRTLTDSSIKPAAGSAGTRCRPLSTSPSRPWST